jgi:hypothetical protein
LILTQGWAVHAAARVTAVVAAAQLSLLLHCTAYLLQILP